MQGRRGPDHELIAGSLAHYEDPAYYTHSYSQRIDDTQMYVEMAVKSGGPVLEIGIGNGRIALPIARHGVSITGIDHSRPMLADLKRRLKAESREVRARVTPVFGDMRKTRLKKRFPLVIATFNTALHLYERPDVEGFLACVRSHLSPRGEFVVDMSVPQPVDLAREPGKAYRTPRFRHPTEGVVRYEERFDYDRARQILFVAMSFAPISEPDREFMTPLAHRQFFPREWEALLHYNGFEVTDLFGDFHRGAFDRNSEVMVWHCKVRR
jgi:SAM-dependent methyltransferase